MNDLQPIPKIKAVKPELPARLVVTWANRTKAEVDLSGWIGTGGDLLAPIGDPAVFMLAKPGEWGASVQWGDNEDLAIDSFHLKLLADQQRPLDRDALIEWQARVKISNAEAADLVGVGLSTWNNYRAGITPVPQPVQIVCRAVERDPVLLHAYYRPRKMGRPKAASA